MNQPYTYKEVCITCGNEFTYTLKKERLASQYRRKYCSACRRLRYLGHLTNRHHNEQSYLSSRGYLMVRLLNDRQDVVGNYIAEHRLVMEHKLGRPLRKYETVHHKDCNKLNNEESNLELWLSSHLSGIRASDLYCPHCNKPYYNNHQ